MPDNNSDDHIPKGEVIGVIIGAVCILLLISLVPFGVIWYNRRTAPTRTANELRNMDVDGSVRCISVEEWLSGQPRNAEGYVREICPICLSSLVMDAEDGVVALPARVFSAESESRRGEEVGRMESGEIMHGNRILVLSRCGHSFHSACLAAWFVYGRYKCPICQASYAPEDETYWVRL